MKRKWIVRGLALLPLPLALLVRWLFSTQPDTAEYYAVHIYPHIARVVSNVMAILPVPVIEIGLVGYLAVQVRWLLRRRWWRVVATCLLVPAVFLGGWGLNYLRVPLEETLGLNVQPSATDELVALCDLLIEDANRTHTQAPDNLLAPVPAALDAAAVRWPIPKGNFPAPKAALTSPLLSRFLIEGITSPWTLEALVNTRIPAFSIPFAACHEGAHVRGFAREEDASVIAYLACMASDEPFFQYSGAMGALLSSLNALRGVDDAAYAACYAKISGPVQQDIQTHAAYWAQYRNTKPAQISHQTNDAYLTAVSGGTQSVRSYGRIVDLLLALMREGEMFS